MGIMSRMMREGFACRRAEGRLEPAARPNITCLLVSVVSGARAPFPLPAAQSPIASTAASLIAW